LSVLEKPDDFLVNLVRARLVDRKKAELPVPLPIAAGRILKREENFRRVRVEARLSFFAKKDGLTELELSDGPARVHVHVVGDISPPPDNSIVQVRGDCEAVRDSNNELVPGNIWVSSPADIAWQDIDENWTEFKPIPMHSLAPSNPDLVVDRLIQVRGRVIRRESPDAWSIQGDDIFQGYTSTDGTNWTSIGPPVEFTMTDSALVGFAVASHQANGVAGIRLDHISGVSSVLENAEIGDPPVAGGLELNGNTFAIRGSGNDIWGPSDQCHFTFQKMAGGREIVVHVAGLEGADSRAKAGIMIRESLDSQSPWAAMLVGPAHRVGFQARRGPGKNAAGAIQTLPAEWLKLTRSRQNLLIRTDAPEKLEPGQALNIMGTLAWEAERPVLTHVHIRSDLKSAATKSDSPAVDPQAPAGELHNVPIGDLTSEANKVQLAGRAPRFRIRGVVTFNGQLAGEPLFFVQDSSGACLVRPRANVSREPFQVGHIVELTGNPAVTNSVTEFLPNGIADLGVGTLPKPLLFPIDDSAVEGKQYGQWTEIVGIGRSIDRNNTLFVMTSDGLLPVCVGSGLVIPLTNCVNALMRIRGVFWQTPSRTLLSPSENFIEIKEPSFEDAFNIPAFSVARLRELKIIPQSVHRLKVAGVVTCSRDDFFFVQDESGGIRVDNKITPGINVGDEVEVVGFPSREATAMTGTLVRKKSSGRLAPPVGFSLDQAADQPNNRLVSLDATLLEQQLWRGMQTLELQSGQRAFRAVLPTGAGKLPPIDNGSRIRLTGVSQIESSPHEASGGGMPIVASLELLLRSPDDVAVLERPPWWNWKYTAAGFCALALVLIVSLLWIRMLRRRVVQKTQQLQETMDKLQKETQISATLAERDRLAGEIHDSLEQGLSAIMMQMEAAAKLVHRPEEVGHYLAMARNMANFSRTEVQHAVWDLQSPMLENADLGTALQQVAREISAGDTPHVAVHISGEVRPLPSFLEHHLLRIGQEGITNAVKHGTPKIINLILDYGTHNVTLMIRDDGCGFDPHIVAAGNGHFGLQGIRVRARKIKGALTISSNPGEGTTIQVVAPLGDSIPNPQS
jgi:signal transduction histidine kinase